MQAAVGVKQLDRLEGFIEARRQNFNRLKQGMKAFEEFFILPEATEKSNPSWFGFPLTVRADAPFKRDDLLKFLNDKKIGTRLLFAGNLIRQPYMKGRNYRVFGDATNSDIVMRDTFWIGVYPGLEQPETDYILDMVKSFCKK